MDKMLYPEKIFEFTNRYINKNEWAGNVRILQIGETCLDKGAEIGDHIQLCHEITFVISGEGWLEADGEKVKCSSGCIQLVSRGVKHNVKSDNDSRLRYIHFAFDFDESEPHILAEFYSKCNNVLLSNDREIGTILNMLVKEYFNDVSFSGIAKNSLVQLVLVLIWRNVNQQRADYPQVSDTKTVGDRVYQILSYIDSHISEKLTVKSIADKFYYSNDYVSHLFKEKTGISLREYIVAAKMKYAQMLLEEKKMSVSEVVEMSGYSSVQSFCRMFKKYTGYTPGDFKRKE